MNLPNKITTLRMILVVFVATFLLLPSEWFMTIPYIDVSLNFFIAWILFIIASLSDMLDGKIARKYNMVTDYGKFMDPIADKLLVNTTLIILASYGPIRVNVICVIIMIARDIVVDAVRLNAMRKNVVVAANIFGKLKTVFQMVTIPFVMLNGFPFNYLFKEHTYIFLDVLLSITCAMSLISGFIYLYRGRKYIQCAK